MNRILAILAILRRCSAILVVIAIAIFFAVLARAAFLRDKAEAEAKHLRPWTLRLARVSRTYLDPNDAESMRTAEGTVSVGPCLRWTVGDLCAGGVQAKATLCLHFVDDDGEEAGTFKIVDPVEARAFGNGLEHAASEVMCPEEMR